jgi:hypothetical protein
MMTQEKGDGKEFISHAPGYWPETSPELWNDWKWQLKNRVTSLAQLERHLKLSDEERSGVLLSGDKLALTPTTRSGARLFHGSRKPGPPSTTWLIRAAKIHTCRCQD